ncbi:MAG: single-stranded DNA-binding protein [Bacilli bacterium]|nr:single-stranded DNA-binding protein [Bacilli bacterium]
MLNQVVMVGRLTKDPEVIETENGNKVSNIAIAVPRSFKNEEGVYETDFIEVTMWNGIAENTAAYCHKGDIVGVKGRIQVDNYEKDGEKKSVQKVIAEKLTFLSSKAKSEPEPAL